MNVFPAADVFIDSNIIIRNCYDFHSGDLERLRNYVEMGIIRLITSEIVVKEVDNNLKQDVTRYASELRNFISKRNPINELRYLDEKHKFLLEDFSNLGWENYISNQWHTYLKTTECEIIPVGSVSIDEIVQDYFNLKPPFENAKLKKSEFPDAIIIKSLIEYSRDSLVTTYILTDDKGWINSFPDENLILWGESSKRFIVIDNINAILKNIYKIETDETKSASILLSDIKNLENAIISVVRKDIENMSAIVENKKSYLVDLNDDYDEIEEIVVVGIIPTFSSFENITKTNITTIFDTNISLDITFTQTDYDNSIYDSEDKEYLFLKHRRFVQCHNCDTSIIVEFKNQENLSYEISSIKYPYEVDLSEDTCVDVYEEEYDSFDVYDDSMDLNEPVDDK